MAEREPPHCCCRLVSCQVWLRLAVETEKPCDLRGPPGVMEGLRGGGEEGEVEVAAGGGGGALKAVGDI